MEEAKEEVEEIVEFLKDQKNLVGLEENSSGALLVGPRARVKLYWLEL